MFMAGEYLDANSSIWTNLHGHNHPRLNRALQSQLRKVAHVSALGFANPPAARLAARLIELARSSGEPALTKVFFSDNGSTAMEVALKLAYEFTRRSGRTAKPRFLSLAGAYHGDTVGAVSLGHIDLFHRAYGGLLFKSDQVMAPYCYRCPFNRARPERADAREYRRCQWQCVDQVEARFARATRQQRPYSAFVFEPRIQGAAGMIPQPDGWLERVAKIARAHRALLIADEVLTAFGRAGSSENPKSGMPLLASHLEGVQPDFVALAKGLTGGYLPMAATLTTPAVFAAFLGDYAEFKTFFHGHSYTANPLAAATALANLDLLDSSASIHARHRLHTALRARTRLPLGAPRRWRCPPGWPHRRCRAGQKLAHARTLRPPRSSGHPRMRSHGAAGRSHAAHRQRGRDRAALLRLSGAGPTHHPRAAPFGCRGPGNPLKRGRQDQPSNRVRQVRRRPWPFVHRSSFDLVPPVRNA